jgi:putative ABC transport system permease protein
MILVLRNLKRLPLRNGLIAASIALAFLLLALLQGFLTSLQQDAGGASANRLFVVSKLDPTEGLPVALASEIAQIEGVKVVSWGSVFAGTSGTSRQMVAGYAIDPNSFFRVFPDIKVDDSAVRSMTNTPNAILVGRVLAERRNWSVGDRVTIESRDAFRLDGSPDWEFAVGGIYDVPDDRDRASLILINYDYFDRARSAEKGRAGAFLVRIEESATAASVGRMIDQRYTNSSNETETASESELAVQRIRQIGDINFIVRAAGLSTFLALLLSIAAALAYGANERRRDFATMRAFGFSAERITGLLLAESVVLCVGAALVGLVGAALTAPLALHFVGIVTQPIHAWFEILSLSIALAVISVVIPIYAVWTTGVASTLARS